MHQWEPKRTGCCSLLILWQPWHPSRFVGMLAASLSAAQCAQSAQLCMELLQNAAQWKGRRILLKDSSSSSLGGWLHNVQQSLEWNKQAHGLQDEQMISFPCLPVGYAIHQSEWRNGQETKKFKSLISTISPYLLVVPSFLEHFLILLAISKFNKNYDLSPELERL